MSAALRSRRVLFVSNGHGEDWIAAAIVRALPPGLEIDAYPMVGTGGAYADICPIVGPRAQVASEGWRNVKGSWRRDIMGGALATVPPALSFLRAVRDHYQTVVVVGDMVGILAALSTGHRDLLYIDVYKTGAARLYSPLERRAIKRTCRTVFCRAESLASPLRRLGIDARAAGNVMMDTIPTLAYDAAGRRRKRLGLTLLPGSRALTVESFAVQVEALRTVPDEERPDVFLAVAGGVDVAALAEATGLSQSIWPTAEPGDLGALQDRDLTIHMARGAALGQLISASDLVMSQAGTATVQALGSGRPAITFMNPRDRRSRFRDEQGLFGDARLVTTPDASSVGKALRTLLNDDADRQRRAAIGRERIGGPGALQEIVAVLCETAGQIPPAVEA
ncbi:hypothetical protein GCM10007989_28220 [Devosia pacifica]|uniref:Uncharacterized protein n=1 Tax=Devosia pacifica TaxID=1335967 RepID=A0A918VWA6_9HYPH|nr:hypothetical protein [Devosia pacifica]GHA30676.1 hypothetical protein GCM10007989_28220 [Devosia pacifica]